MTTAPGDLDRAVDALTANRDRWIRFPIRERRTLLAACIDATHAVAADAVSAGCRAKGLAFDSPAAVEEWLSGPVAVLRQLRLLDETLAAIDRDGHPHLSRHAIHQRPDGQVVVRVFPRTLADRLLFAGFSEEVWLDPGVALDAVIPSMAAIYRRPPASRGRVALVLGAGNVASIGPKDTLHKLFLEHQVVVLKMHPVNEYLGPFIELGLAPLIREGFLRVVYGGADVGAHLVRHPGVDEIHLTGSIESHDAIVWGATPEERARNRAARTPVVAKRVTSELGCVTPVIVLPGPWTHRQIAFHARNVATMAALNASCNCNAAKTLVTWKGWPQRDAFLGAVEETFAGLPPRRAYYPGSDAKYRAFTEAHPDASRVGAGEPGTLPWTTIFGVDPHATSDIVFTREAWCTILAETALDAGDEAEFLDRAVAFVNDHVEGTLSMVVIVHPATAARLGDRIERAVAALRYGTIGVNHWPALSFVLGVAPWGGFPGHTLDDAGSGIGFVHNTLMLDRPQKSVLRGPFTVWPTPPWFVGHRRAHVVSRRLAAFEARPALWRVPGIALATIVGS